MTTARDFARAVNTACLDWNKKPARRKSPTGGITRTWKAAGYYIVQHMADPCRYVCFEYRSTYDIIDDRTIIGWHPIGENRTLKAAKDRCQTRRNIAISARKS